MKIPEWCDYKTQTCSIGRNRYSVARLVSLSKDLKIMDVPLDHLNVFNTYKHLSMREMIMHFKAIQGADLKYPIILDEDGEIMDGRHRIMKAIMEGNETIKAVRFDVNPPACSVDEIK